jgi:hypothetical protein
LTNQIDEFIETNQTAGTDNACFGYQLHQAGIGCFQLLQHTHLNCLDFVGVKHVHSPRLVNLIILWTKKTRRYRCSELRMLESSRLPIQILDHDRSQTRT